MTEFAPLESFGNRKPAMATPLVTCTRCRAILPPARLENKDWFSCDSCGISLRLDVFPALFRRMPGGLAPQPVVAQGEANCFYHASKKAVVPCDSCGRFLCALCDLELDGRHLCPACLETGRAKGKMEKLIDERMLPDYLALALVFLPLLIGFWPSLLGAPAALYVVIRHWRASGSLTSRHTRLRLAAAAVLAIAEIIGWIIFFTYLAAK